MDRWRVELLFLIKYFKTPKVYTSMLTQEQGSKVLEYTRKVFENYIEGQTIPDPPDEDFFKENKGVFVTLKGGDNLRGCVGVPSPRFKLGEAIRRAAMSAVDDRRFPRVEKHETKKIDIEVTILTEPKTIEVQDPSDYLKKIEIGEDGLIIERGSKSGLLLPQVPVEQDWNCKEYLRGLCKKALLDPDAWKNSSTEIKSFRGQIFRE